MNFTRKGLILLALVLAADAVSLRSENIYWPFTALDLAKQRATSISCANNLKRLVLGARLWSSENGGRGPSTIQVFTHHLESPALLFCPANVGHQVVTNWDEFDWGQLDYEWLAQADWDNPADIVGQCRIHDHGGRVDGAVESPRFGYRGGWPTIVAGPLDQGATPGSEVRFEVQIAPGAFLPVSYQWQREQLYYVTNATFVVDADDPQGGYWTTNRRANFAITVLRGQTNASYVIPNAQTNHSDYYGVVVRNVLGAAASRESRLVVDSSVVAMATDPYWSALNCVNNLKQIALFGRMLASDHAERLPQSLTAMTNSYGQPIFGWPIVLYCRFDSGRIAPADWTGVDFADTSYEVLPVNLPADEDPSASFCRCKVHGFYARADGEVVWKPRCHGIRLLTNDVTELSVTVFAGLTHRLEASTNLKDWAPLGSLPPTEGSFFLYETNRYSQRFYRIRSE